MSGLATQVQASSTQQAENNPWKNMLNEAGKKRKNEIDSEDFFKLLSTSMANQNPWAEQNGNGTEAITQLATMASVGQIRDTMTAFAQMTSEKSAEAANSYLGKEVVAFREKTNFEGRVVEVNKDDKGKIWLKLDSGKEFNLNEIKTVRIPKEVQNANGGIATA